MTQPEDLIVGKSVEEIEAENSNRVNPPVSTEDRRDHAGTVLIPAVGIPAAGGQLGVGQTGAGALGGLPGIIGTELRDDGSGPAGGRGRRDGTSGDVDTDSSEE